MTERVTHDSPHSDNDEEGLLFSLDEGRTGVVLDDEQLATMDQAEITRIMVPLTRHLMGATLRLEDYEDLAGVVKKEITVDDKGRRWQSSSLSVAGLAKMGLKKRDRTPYYPPAKVGKHAKR